MNQPVLYFSNLCPDTPPFVAALAALQVLTVLALLLVVVWGH